MSEIDISKNVKSEFQIDNEWEEIMSTDIMVRTISPGRGNIGEMNTIVKCDFVCYKSNPNHERLELIETLENQRFKIGEADCVPGLELGLRYARQYSHILIYCSSKFGYGFTGRMGNIQQNINPIDPDSDLEFEVKNVEHIDISGLSPISSALEELVLRKQCGNRWFSYKEFLKAGRAYSKGIQSSEAVLTAVTDMLSKEIDDNNKSVCIQFQENYLTCLTNLAAVYLSTNEFTKAKDVCIQVLEMQPVNTRALLRAARASLALDEYEECRACLDRLTELDPNNQEIAKERLKLRKAILNYKQQSRKIALTMSKNLFEISDATPVSGAGYNNPETENDPSTTISELVETDVVVEEISEDSIHDNVIDTQNNNENKDKGPIKQYSLILLMTSLLVIIISLLIIVFLIYYRNTTISSHTPVDNIENREDWEF